MGSAACSELASRLHDALHAHFRGVDSCQWTDAADSSNSSHASSSAFVLSVEVTSSRVEQFSHTDASADLQLMLDATLGAQATGTDATANATMPDAAIAAAFICLQSLDAVQGSELPGLPVPVFPATADGGAGPVAASLDRLLLVSVQTQAATCPQRSDVDKAIDLEVARLQEGIVEFLLVDSAVCYFFSCRCGAQASTL